MWRCEWCGAEFEKPRFHVTEVTTFYGTMGIDVCPECGEDCIEEVRDDDD